VLSIEKYGDDDDDDDDDDELKAKFGSCTRKTFDRFTYKRQLYLEHHT
jgi:hypothetical protein